MASGKSSVGRCLARLIGYRFVDTDEVIAAREGRSIADLWQERGEAYFRDREAELARELAQQSPVVIATGGGMLLSADNREVLGPPSAVICLHSDPAVLIERIRQQGDRPLMFTEHIERRIDELLAERDSVYSNFELHLDTTALRPDEAAHEAAELLGIPALSVVTEESSGACPVVVRAGLLADGAAIAQYLEGARRVFVITNEVVFPLHGAALLGALGHGGNVEVVVIELPDGERQKSFAGLGRVLDEMAGYSADRSSLVAGFGGGVICDLAGFAASIYMRGLPVLQLPTTLLAQVDAAIGGKTAIDHPAAKNLIGTFHQPRAVLADPTLLATLPRRELANGLAEAIKTALIGSRELFELLERSAGRALDGDIDLHTSIIEQCAAIKSQIVSADPHDHGIRRLLNLGHTAGHALEAVGEYSELSHGQAVALGLLVACRISTELGLAEPGLYERVERLVELCELPSRSALAGDPRIFEHLRLDKKNVEGKLRMVLPLSPGDVVLTAEVDAAQIARALEAIA